MVKRKQYSAAFKEMVALSETRGDGTLAELASRYKIHPDMITKWKRWQAKRPLLCVSTCHHQPYRSLRYSLQSATLFPHRCLTELARVAGETQANVSSG